MEAGTGMRPLLLLPEMLLFAAGLATLVGGSFLPRHRQWVTRVLAVVALLVVLAVAVTRLGGPAREAFERTFVVDTGTGVARALAVVATLLVLAVAADEVAGSARESETYALLLFATAGTLVLAGARDLLVLAVGFLLAGIPLYGLVGLAGTAEGAEAAMKAYLMGALFGILLLAGVTVLAGLAGTTGYDGLGDRLAGMPVAAVTAGAVGVVAGLMFEAGGVPAHFWVPDAAQGGNATAATFLTTVPKIGAVVAVYRLVVVLPVGSAAVLVAVFAVVGMTLGNLAAYWQRDPRRLLGWSTVAQVGFLLVPVAVAGRSGLAWPSLLVYLTGYTVTNVAAFAVTAAVPDRRTLEDFRGLAPRAPWLAAALVVALLGLVGTPPTAVFVGKLTTATAAWDGGYPWLAVAVFVNGLLSLFYYLRWIVPVFRRAGDGPAVDGRPWATWVAVVSAAISLAVGLAAGGVWDLASRV